MAAKGGHTRLCKFLLEETPSFYDDSALNSALDVAVTQALSNLYPNALAEDFYNLFVADHGLELGLAGSRATESAHTLRTALALLLSDNSFRVVLASQPASFIDLPFEQRFTIAIDCVGWPADAFWTLLNHSDPTELVQKANDQGKTALHWAAAHFGEWLRRSRNLGGQHKVSDRIRGYGKLLSRLISMGANVHALCFSESTWAVETWGFCEKDPFLVFLEGVVTQHTHHWNSVTLANAVCQWGEMLAEGGICLSKYITAENEFLRSVQCRDMENTQINDPWFAGPVILPVKLSIADDSVLRLEVYELPYLHVWKSKALSVPGAWSTSDASLDTISWNPGELDEREGFRWVHIGIKLMKPHVNRVGISNTFEAIDVLAGGAADEQRLDLEGAQDDLGRVASMMLRERKTRWHRGDTPSCRRRTSSNPPPMKKYPLFGDLLSAYRDTIVHVRSPSGWKYQVHKCALDSRWRRCSHDLSGAHLLRTCMQGRCQENLVAFSMEQGGLESWLLRDESRIDVATRYAAKFCPSQMSIIDATLDRATERSRLAAELDTLKDMSLGGGDSQSEYGYGRIRYS
jgi:hypothetical protein